MRILIAEDDNPSRLILERTLTKLGHDVQSCADGSQAARVLEAPSGPRLAILDWSMPGMTGIELCKKIRSDPATSGMYVFILSARFRKEDVVEGINAGADDYLIKPLNVAELQARLHAAERILNLQASLEARVNELEATLRRHDLLGEIVGHHRAESTSVPLPSECKGCDSRCVFRDIGCMQPLVREVFDPWKIKLTWTPISDKPMTSVPVCYTAWTTLVAVDRGAELNMVIELSQAYAQEFCRTVLGKKAVPQTSDLSEVLAGVMNLLQARLRAALARVGHDVIMPIAPQAILSPSPAALLTGMPAGSNACQLMSDPAGLRVAVYRQYSDPHDVPVQQLASNHVLVDTLASPECPDVPLLAKGTLLQDRYRTRIANRLEPGQQLKIVELSPVFTVFNRGGVIP